MDMYGACKPLASLQQLQLPFQVLTSVYHILNYGSGQNRLHLARFRLICTSILHFASPTLIPFAMSPCIFPLTSLPLLFSIRFFWILHLSASSFFGWLYLYFSSNCLFPRRFLVSSGMNVWLLHPSCFLCLLFSRSSPCAFSAIFRRFCHCTEYVPRQTLTSCHDRPICLMALIASPYQYMLSCLACC